MGGRGGVWEVGEVGEVLVWPAMTVPRTHVCGTVVVGQTRKVWAGR